MNLASHRYYAAHWAFVDAMKRANKWVPQEPGNSSPWNTGEPLAWTENGWPLPKEGQAAGTLMYRGAEGHYPAGKYTVRFDGTGKITLGMDAQSTSITGGGPTAVPVEPSNTGIYLRIDRSDPEDPVRNIRVWLPGFAGIDRTFHPLFLERLEPFGVLRFMDWQSTNSSPLSEWADRTKPRRYSQDRQGYGVAVEYMVELANKLDADPWFCMPHKATDRFVRKFAELVKERLEADRRVYLEYSNETWNGAFAQKAYCERRGVETGLAPEGQTHKAGHLYYAKRSMEVGRIWREVFGADSERIVEVMAAQAANPWVAETRLAFREAGKKVDAVAIAPYFSIRDRQQKFDQLDGPPTVRDILRLMGEHIRNRSVDMISRHNKLAEQYGLRLIAYEGGQHLVARNDKGLREKFVAANRHPRMYELYARMLNAWRNHGGGLMVHYNYASLPGKWGTWGALEYQDQPLREAQKYRALKHAAEGRLPKLGLNEPQMHSFGVFD